MHLRLQNLLLFGLLVLVCWLQHWLLYAQYLVAFCAFGIWRNYIDGEEHAGLGSLQHLLSFFGMVIGLMMGGLTNFLAASTWEHFLMLWPGMFVLGCGYLLGLPHYGKRVVGWGVVALGWLWVCVRLEDGGLWGGAMTATMAIFLVPLQLVMLYHLVWEEVAGLWMKRVASGRRQV